MISRFCDWCTQTALLTISVITTFLLTMYKTDTERKLFATQMLIGVQFVYKTGDILGVVICQGHD